MIKLYRRENGRVVEYHEAWVHGSKIVEHWGELGERGQTREHRRRKKLREEEDLAQILSQAMAEGFESIDIDDHSRLIIEYSIDGMGSARDLDNRYSLEDRMNDTLGWTGLGHCDGGSIGSGTMEVCCFVVDFETAKWAVMRDLKGTEFGDYSRIYDEDNH
jgi:hypothetical protein